MNHRGEVLRRPIVVALCATLVALAPLRASEPSEPSRGERMLVGALLGGREVGTLDVRWTEAGYLIPLAEFVELSGCRLEEGPDGRTLQTPLGAVALRPEDLREAEGTLYIREDVIESKLAAKVIFDPSRYALGFDLPWRAVEVGSAANRPPLHPEATAPAASLSTIHLDLRYQQHGERDDWRGLTALGGALGGGHWRLRYEGSPDGPGYLRDYAWLYRGRQHLWLAGNQRVRIHPLLPGLELTGLQYAWTNQHLDLFSRGGVAGELLPREMQPISSFEGYGPAAGAAELWIDGVMVERQAIGLDGRYRFLDVSIPARQASEVEVRLYDRHSPGVPVEVVQETRTASAYLLPGGASMQAAGAGARGNLAQNELVEPFEPVGGAGFYQTRHGLSDALTVEAAVQAGRGGAQAFGGFVSRVGRDFVMSFGLGGSSESAYGYSLEIEGLPRPWRLLGRIQATEAGYDPLYPHAQRNDYLEVGYAASTDLDVAVVGRSRRNATAAVDYVLPAVSWRPAPPLWLGARPDLDGDYRLFLMYRLHARTRLTVHSAKSRYFAQWWQDLGPRLRLTLDADLGGGLPDREALLLTGYGGSRWRPTWTVGPLWSEGRMGYLVAGRVTLVPGIVAQARLESAATGAGFAEPEGKRLLFNVVADYGLAGGRLVEGRPLDIREGRGGIAGVVHVDAPRSLGPFDLSDLPVLLEGRRAARTNARGEFFIGELKPGVYQVELDPAHMPIELSLQVRSVVAEVAGAAVTRVDFVARPEFGIAGRVLDPRGGPLAGADLELLDGSRQIVARARTDRFGLYRIDGLEIGGYLLRLRPFSVPGLPPDEPSRVVRVADDYLFDQDLTVPDREPAGPTTAAPGSPD